MGSTSNAENWQTVFLTEYGVKDTGKTETVIVDGNKVKIPVFVEDKSQVIFKGTVNRHSIGADGWCMYYSILEAFGIDPTPSDAQCLAKYLVDRLSQEKIDELTQFISDTVVFPSDPSNNTVRGFFTEVIVTNNTDPYIFFGGKRRTYVTDVRDYLKGLWTPLRDIPGQPPTATGPYIWPTFLVFSDAIKDLVGPFLLYTNTYKLPGQESAPKNQLSLIEPQSNIVEQAKHLAILNTGAHFELLTPSGADYIADIRTVDEAPEAFRNMFASCRRSAPTQPQIQEDNDLSMVHTYNRILQVALDAYAKDNTEINKKNIHDLYTEVTAKYNNSTYRDLLHVNAPEGFVLPSLKESYEKYINGDCSVLYRLDVLLYIAEINGLLQNKDSSLTDLVLANFHGTSDGIIPAVTESCPVTLSNATSQTLQQLITAATDELAQQVISAKAALEQAQAAHSDLTTSQPTVSSSQEVSVASGPSLYTKATSALSNAVSSFSNKIGDLYTMLATKKRVLATTTDPAKRAELDTTVRDLEKKIDMLNIDALKIQVAELTKKVATTPDLAKQIAELKKQIEVIKERPATVVEKVMVPTVPVAFSSAVDAKLRNYRPLVKVEPIPLPVVVDVSESPVSVVRSAVPSAVPAWATTLFDYTDVKSCHTSAFMPDGCESQTLLGHLIGADQVKNSDRFEKSAPMVALHNLEKQLSKETDEGKRASLKKQIKENYTDRTIDIVTADGSRLPFKVANPYTAQAGRSKVVSFGDPTGLGINSANLAIIKTGIIPKEILADKAMTVSLLRSMWACSQGGAATSPDCYPLQVLGELYEYQAFKKQNEYKDKAKGLLELPAWPVIATMVGALRYAIPTVDISSGAINVTPVVEGATAATTGTTTVATGTTGTTVATTGTAVAATATTVKARPQPLLPTTFGGGIRMTNFLIPNTFGFAPLKPI